MFLPIRAAASSSSFLRRPVITTCAPSSTKRFAVAKPMPLLPPVTTATFPESLPMVQPPHSTFLGCKRGANLQNADSFGKYSVKQRKLATHSSRNSEKGSQFYGHLSYRS